MQNIKYYVAAFCALIAIISMIINIILIRTLKSSQNKTITNKVNDVIKMVNSALKQSGFENVANLLTFLFTATTAAPSDEAATSSPSEEKTEETPPKE